MRYAESTNRKWEALRNAYENLPGYDSGRGLCGLSGCFTLPECDKWC